MDQPTHTNDSGNGCLNTALYFLAGVFTFLSHCSAEEIYTWIFRFFSLLSIIFILIINWPKVKAALGYKTKKKGDDPETNVL